MDFRSLNNTITQLLTALRGNADQGRAILMDRRDTSFVGTAEDVADEEVISAIMVSLATMEQLDYQTRLRTVAHEDWRDCNVPYTMFSSLAFNNDR